MDQQNYASRIEAARRDPEELGRIANELASVSGSDAATLRFRALLMRVKLRRAADASASPSTTPQWLTNLGIREIDGRALHNYGLSDRAFTDLEAALKARVVALRIQPNNVLAAQFVLWGAEWFRRCYDGTGQRWEALGAPLGMRADWADYRRLTDLGLKHWRIPPLLINGTHHRLAAIARQGGFPLAAVEGQGSGWAPRFLGQLVGLLLDEPMPSLETGDRIANGLMTMVPTTWRNPEIRIVSAELATEIVRLRVLAESQGVPAGSLMSAWLDQNLPDWRDDVPIGVSSAAGRALVDGLMKTVVLQGGGNAVGVRRLLTLGPDGRRERVELKLNGVLSDGQGRAITPDLSEEWTRLRLFPAGQLARFVSGELATADPADGGVWIARQSVNRTGFDLSASIAITTELRGGGQRVGREFVLPGGGAVSQGARVYVAENVADGTQPSDFLLIGSGSGGYRPQTLYIDVPASWTCSPRDENATCAQVETDVSIGRSLWSVTEAAIAKSPGGDTYLFRTAQKGDSRDSLSLIGDHAVGCTASDDSLPVFLGTPRFQLCEGRRERSPSGGELFWRMRGKSEWRTNPENAFDGVCEFAWRDSVTGHIRDRRDAIVLPSEFQVIRRRVGDWLELTVDGWSGRLEFEGATRTTDGAFRFPLRGSSRAFCTLRLYDAAEVPFALTVPLPHDAWIDDWAAGAVAPNSRLSLSSINRYVARTDSRCELMADLLDRNRRTVSQGIASWWVDGELPLSAVRDDIAALLRPLGDIRASVKLNFNDSRENFWYVSEFDHEIGRESRGWVPDQAVTDPEARVVGRALHDPAHEHDFGPYGLMASQNHRPIELPSLRGDWLIYLRSNERVLSRPQLIPGNELTSQPDTPLKKAMAIADYHGRTAALSALLDDALAEPTAGDTRRLIRAMIDLAASLDGLPPATFDILMQICSRPLLGAMMLFSAAPHELEPILRVAEGLPFTWSLTPADCWDKAAQAQGEYLFSQLPDEAAVIAEMISDRRKALAEHEPALATLLGLRVERQSLQSAANAFLNRSEDRIETIANPFRPAHADALGTWPVGEHFWRALDAPVAAALAALGRIELDQPQIRCIKEVGRRHLRWFREGFTAAVEENIRG